MVVLLYKKSAILGIVIATLLLVMFGNVTFAQETDNEIETTTEAATTTEEVASVSTSTEVDFTNPYKTEELIGEKKVFGDFVLSPGKVELTIPPGESKTVMLDVANRMADTKLFIIDIEDIGGSKNVEQPVVLLGDDRGPYSLKDYISIEKTRFDLVPNHRALVPVTISVPPDAEPGGMYGSVLVRTVTKEAKAADEVNPVPQSAIVSRIGTLFFITVPGDVEAEGKLLEFKTKSDTNWFEKGPVDFQILYENTGSVHLNPYGELRVTNMFGEEVGFVELQPWFTLPGSLRLREVAWNREMLYGKYTAVLQLNRGYGDLIDEAQVTFWVIPWKLALGVFAGLFIFFLLIRKFFRSFEFKRRES